MLSQRSVLGMGLVLLSIITAASIGLDLKSRFDAGWMDKTVELLRRLSDIRQLVRDAESAARGYALYDDVRLADEYRASLQQIAPAFAELKQRLKDTPEVEELVETTETLVGRRLAVTSEGIARQAAGDTAGLAAMIHSMLGRDLMRTINGNFDRLLAGQRRSLDQRIRDSQRTRVILLGIDVIGAVLILLFAAVLIREARRSSRELEASLRVTEAVNQTLEAAVDERTRHLLKAHEELRQSASIMKSTFDGMAEAVLVIDPKGEVVLSNQAAERFLRYRPGATSEQLRARNKVYQADGVTELASGDRPVDRAMRGERFEGMEVVFRQYRRRDPIHVVISCHPLHDAAGAFSGAALVYHDVTASREAERQLSQAQKLDAIGKLTGGVAHDFNNMLTVITGTTEMLVAELKDQPELRKTAALIDQAADRCSELVTHLLAFARQQPLQPRIVDVNQTVLDLAKLLRPTLGEQIEIETVLQDELPAAHVDPSQLAHSLLNMAINARDAMPTGGRLVMETRETRFDEAGTQADAKLPYAGIPSGACVEIMVRDSGSGMPADIRDKVFEPFFTTKAAGKGSGLGLSMVYGFVKQSGGHIRIESETGKGTTIRLHLPLAGAAAEQLPCEGSPPMAGGNETILIVEDDEMVRNFVTGQLQSLGYHTVTVADSQAALAIIERGQRFDLLFTDIVMPGGTGHELAEEVSKRRAGTKVLYTSGYSDHAIVHDGEHHRELNLLPKPFRRAQLARMVRQAIEGQAKAS